MRNLLLALVSVAVFLGGLEGGARLLGFGRVDPVADYIADWERQWDGDFYTLGPRPGVNREGLRDAEHDEARVPGSRRIACLGDSVTFGYRLPRELAVPAQLGQALAARGEPAEVMNVALPGWSTRQQRIAYQRIVRRYRPDLTLLGFCLNDVAELQNNLGRPPRLITALYRRSSLVRALLRPRAWEIRRVEELFLEHDAPRVEQAWVRVRAELEALLEDVRRDGGRFALLVYPFRFQLEPGAPPPRPQQRLSAWARAHGVPFVDPLPTLSRLGPSAFLDYDHLSPEGARLVAQEIALRGLAGGARAGAARAAPQAGARASRR